MTIIVSIIVICTCLLLKIVLNPYAPDKGDGSNEGHNICFL